MISIVMVQHNHPELTARAAESLQQHHGGKADLIVIDNGSSEGARAAAERLTECRVLYSPVNLGFAAANNLGARYSRGDLLLFLNNDTRVFKEILPSIETYFEENPSCGAAGLELLTTGGTVQISSGKFPTVWTEWRTRQGYDPYRGTSTACRDWVSGAALAVRRSVFEQVGGFDEEYFMYFEDIDLCARIWRAGYEIHYLRTVPVVHLGGGSQPDGAPPAIRKEYRRSQILYYRRHASAADNVLLRGYLFVKFLPRRLIGNHDERAVASFVLSILFVWRNGNRH
jgi:GT2 family glycosyltransferase